MPENESKKEREMLGQMQLKVSVAQQHRVEHVDDRVDILVEGVDKLDEVDVAAEVFRCNAIVMDRGQQDFDSPERIDIAKNERALVVFHIGTVTAGVAEAVAGKSAGADNPTNIGEQVRGFRRACQQKCQWMLA